MKVTIIGGGGLVGSTAAYALQCGQLVSELALIDANRDAAHGQATDLENGAALVSDMRVWAGDYADVPTSDMVVITAGSRRKPDESRLDLIHRNVDLFLGVLDAARQAGWKEQAILLVVSNPVDVLTHMAMERAGLPRERVLGLGTLLDTIRFRGYLARHLQVAPTQVDGLILGEHGDSMVPFWSGVSVAGMPLRDWPGFHNSQEAKILEETKTAGATLIRQKGGSGFAVGLAIREVVKAVARDSRRILPVCTWQQGTYDVRDVSLSIPTEIGRRGVLRHVELPLAPKERLALQQSARVLRDMNAQVAARLGAPGKRSPAADSTQPAAARSAPSKERIIPRSAWDSRQASRVR